tara:strand:- start:964 stop:2349 length:1386 start_codon:yes stop_codon:yes gene_type:complete
MNGYFAAGRISEDEKTDILKLHSSVYNGYRTMQPKVNNEQPLYVYDPAQDKVGAVMSNKGVVKPYTNVGINESTEQKEVCDECGSMMMEGECSECGWKGEVGDMDEQWQAAVAPALERMAAGYVADKAINKVSDMFSGNEGEMEESMLTDVGNKMKNWMNKPFSPDIEDYISKVIDVIEDPEKKDDSEDEDSQPHKTHRRNGKFKKHQYTEAEVSEYETGHLDDIYDESDLNPNAEFDYVKGASNKTNAFHMKEQADDYVDNFEDPDNEDDGFEDINSSEVTDEIEEQGYTGGGNAPDMDLSNIDPAYDFVSDGPMAGGDVYPTEGEMDEEECDECWEKMESAWSEEIDEIDVSGVQGIYGAMEPAFDFDSEGPGKAGPYQHSQYSENHSEDEDAYWEKDLDDNELDVDFEKFNPRDKSWEEITAHTGEDEFSHLDEDIVESVVNQKNKIMEMMNRMKIIK